MFVVVAGSGRRVVFQAGRHAKGRSSSGGAGERQSGQTRCWAKQLQTLSQPVRDRQVTPTKNSNPHTTDRNVCSQPAVRTTAAAGAWPSKQAAIPPQHSTWKTRHHHVRQRRLVDGSLRLDVGRPSECMHAGTRAHVQVRTPTPTACPAQ